ncbi:chorismate mutase [Erwinia rhapontici]|uniref:chorismate mutase n=1 Tax=Erwinia rhapontici TaxID=55212 RepID=UPI003D360817
MTFSCIEDVRKSIDQIDIRLVALIAQRGECVKAAAAFKKDSDAVRAPDRVQKVIDKVRQQAAAHHLPEEIIEKVYRAMIGAFIDYELEQHRQLSESRTPPSSR